MSSVPKQEPKTETPTPTPSLTPPETVPPTPNPTPTPPETVPPTPAPTPANNPPEKKPADKIDKEQLLADISEMAIQLIPPESDRNNPRNANVLGPAITAANRCKISVVKKSTTVMEIEIKSDAAGEMYVVEVIAVVKCPAKDGGIVPIWEQKQQVVSIDQRSPPIKVMKILREKSNEFFKQFSDAVLQARSKVKTK